MSVNTATLDERLKQRLAGYDWFDRIPRAARAMPIADADRKAAWEMYVELVTRVTTQPLEDEEGVEKGALESIYTLFGSVRKIVRDAGPDAAASAALMLALLNHRVRAFTAPWHKRAAEGRFADPAMAGRFRVELRALQLDLRAAADAFAELAGVPALTDYSAP